MSDFNKRYDFDRARPKFDGDRLRSILILLAVLAVTGVIIYFIIPHGNKKDEKKPEVQAPTSAKGSPSPQAAVPPSADADEKSQAPRSTPGNAPNAAAGADAGSSGATGAPGTALSSDTPAEGGVDDPLDRAREITVGPNETLEKIAKDNYTTVEGIKHFNGLKDGMIKNGQKLKVIPGPWRMTVRNNLTLEHAPNGQWQLFKTFPADASGIKGKFVVASLHHNPIWIDAYGRQFAHDDPENPYGAYLLKLAAPAAPKKPLVGYGIHGVDDKTSILKNCGRGHIHVGSRDIELLYYLVCPGTEVNVIPGGTVRNSEM